MENLPNKDYSTVYSFNQLCLPMDAGVLIPTDDSVRLLNGTPPPSHGMLYVFRKYILGAAIENLLYEAV
jgi:hypothetical protein